MTQIQYVDVLLPSPCPPMLRWSAVELLVRLALPCRPYHKDNDSRKLVLAFDTPLPEGAAGVYVAAGGMEQDSLGAQIIDDTFQARRIQQLAPDKLIVKADIALHFNLWLGRAEEQGPSSESLKANIVAKPVADEICALAERVAQYVHQALVQAAAGASIGLPQRRLPWPNGKLFAVHLSHDMDVLGGRYQLWRRYSGWSAGAAAAMAKGDLHRARMQLAKIRRFLTTSEDHHYTVPRLLELEAKYGATASYYFFCSDDLKTRGRHAGRMYRLEDSLAAEAVRLVRQASSEAGVHAFPEDCTDARLLRNRRELMESVSGEPCIGIRQHYLHMDIPLTWRAQHQAGFGYDATLGWNFNIGLRAGTCWPFHVWDGQAGEALELMEIPLTAMDGALSYKWPDCQSWMANLKPLIDAVQQTGGVMSFLLHPERMDEVDYPGLSIFYEEFLATMKSRGGYLASGREIYQAAIQHRTLVKAIV